MKKNIKWLKEEIEEDIKSWGGGNPDYFRGASDAYENVKDWLNQLDEPEVLSQEWIDENKSLINGRSTNPDGTEGDCYDAHYIHVLELQNLLVPEQGELESKIQELIEKYEQEDGEHSNPENAWIDDFIYDLEYLLNDKRYVVVDSKGSYILAKVKGEIMTMGEILEFYGHESVDIDYNLTEQEIKDYDPRYMTFAKSVEELEE